MTKRKVRYTGCFDDECMFVECKGQYKVEGGTAFHESGGQV